MNDTESKNPSQTLSGLFQQHDTLLEMRKTDADIDDAMVDKDYRELTVGLEAEFEQLAKEHPELIHGANPNAARFQSIIRKIRQNKEGKTFDPATYDYVPESLYSAHYASGSLFQTHFDEAGRERLNEIYTGLLSPEIIDEFAEQVHSQKDAADKLGISEKDVEQAYGMLSAIEDGFVEGDGRIEFVVLDLSKDKVSGGESGGQEGLDRVAGLGSFIDKKYLGRVRYSAENSRLSIVLDIVPPEPNNAAFIRRGDDGRLDTESYMPKTKAEAHKLDGRKLLHTKTGEAGLLKRINKALTMPFDQFLDKENYRLDS
jgi:hypothetical protein